MSKNVSVNEGFFGKSREIFPKESWLWFDDE